MNKSHLLINEPALQVLPSLAKEVGLEEAIILQQLHYWLNNPKVDGREHDGKKWIFNTYAEWQDNFPFWSIQQIQRFFLNLEKLGVVISAKLDAKKHDQTKFYTLDYDALCAMDESILIPSNVSNSNDVNKELHRLPETSTDVLKTDEEQPAYIAQADRKIDALLQMATFPGAKREARIDSMLSYLGGVFQRNTETKEWKEFARYIIDMQTRNGWQVERFVKWLLAKPDYKPDFWSVKRMTEFYPSAFYEAEEISIPRPEHKPYQPEAGEFVPAPERKR